jgi:DNA-binding response OmpR family regulator
MPGRDILVVDDNPYFLKLIAPALESQGYRVRTAVSGQGALRLLEEERFDLIITDMVMDDVDGAQVLERAKSRHPDSVVIILTGYPDSPESVAKLKRRADDYWIKPLEEREIFERVAAWLNPENHSSEGRPEI